jgi:hypothetical protein
MLSNSGVSRDFMLVGPQRGQINVCFSIPKLRGLGAGNAPPGNFEKLALNKSNSGAFWAVYFSNQDKN